MVTCKGCGAEFDVRESMEQHYAAKHAKKEPETPIVTKKSKKKPIILISAVAIILIVGYAIVVNLNSEEEKPIVELDDDLTVNLDEVPTRAIHWHPRLAIVINGEQRSVDANLGGAGAVHRGGLLPIHTHDTTGTLHMETGRPTAEVVTLEYFFDTIWRKTFNSQCIFEYCNGPEGSLTMTVNGEPNFQFNKYIPKDNDNIVIEFSDTPAVSAQESVPEVKEFSMTAKQWEFIPDTMLSLSFGMYLLN